MVNNDFKTYETPFRFSADIGDKIDQYEVLGLLGEGSFGIVYKVRQGKGPIRALKLIKLWEIAHERERMALIERFIREFEIGTIDSPYLVKSLEYGKILGNPYIVMEYMGGGSLASWVGKFNSNINRDHIAYQILKGLYELHNRGYFHRDIKPQNILLTETGDAKLTDFGIAGHKTSRLTVVNIFGKARQIFGTWAYLAPEQANNRIAFKAIDAVTDIFSFGVTMFELFTGEYPFPPFRIESDSDLADYIRNVSIGNWENLPKKRNQIPSDWYKVIEGCLHPDFQYKRFRNVNDIIVSLNYKSIDFKQHKPVDADDLAIMITYGEDNAVYPLAELLKKAQRGILTVGRKDPSARNDIEITEGETTYISRRHATIERWADHWLIRDGQWITNEWKTSVNGLYVNSKRVNMRGLRIEYGDIITMGDTILKVTSIN